MCVKRYAILVRTRTVFICTNMSGDEHSGCVDPSVSHIKTYWYLDLIRNHLAPVKEK